MGVGSQTSVGWTTAGTLGIPDSSVRTVWPDRQEPGPHEILEHRLTHHAVYPTQALELLRFQREAGHFEVLGANAVQYLHLRVGP